MADQIAENPDELADRIGEYMMSVSPVLHHWGVELVNIKPGAVTMQMTVREDMANLHRQCHGGVLFTLADGCAGFASNSYNDRTVAASCDIRYLKSAEIDDVVTAKAIEIWRKGRTGLYDVTLTNQDGETIAIMRAHSRVIQGKHLE